MCYSTVSITCAGLALGMSPPYGPHMYVPPITWYRYSEELGMNTENSIVHICGVRGTYCTCGCDQVDLLDSNREDWGSNAWSQYEQTIPLCNTLDFQYK